MKAFPNGKPSNHPPGVFFYLPATIQSLQKKCREATGRNKSRPHILKIYINTPKRKTT